MKFIIAYRGVAIDAHDFQINTGSNDNYYVGGLLHVDDAPAADSVAPDGDSNSRCNLLTPEVGTEVVVESDGVLWYINGRVVSANAPTFADQA